MIAVAFLVAASSAALHMARSAATPRVDTTDRPSVPAAPAIVVDAMRRADVSLDPALVLRAWALGGTAAIVGALALGGVALAVLVTVVVVVGPPCAAHLGRHRSERRLEAALPDALDALARSLRSGASLRQAVLEVAGTTPGALGDELRRVATEVGDGVPLPDALEAWVARRPLHGVRLTAAALGLGAATGGASARAVDGLAATLRTNVAIAAEVRALSSQARLSAMVIALAPLGFTVLAASADPRAAQFLLRTPAGLLCLVAGLGLDVIGALWMRRLSVVRA